MTSFQFFAPCPRGLEVPLADELREIGARLPETGLKVGRDVPGGVHFSGKFAAAMAANLHARVASRVLLKIDARGYRDETDVYEFALIQDWESWFSAQQTLRVDVTAIKSPLRSLEFATLRVKDAICDRLRERTGERPNIDTATPDVRVFVFLSATECTLYLDTSGEALFKRGWRLDKGAAPLRENLAAGILRLTGWQPGTPLYDPMCGSGTFLAEAAQMALGIAPGAQRHFGFEQFRQGKVDAAEWQALKAPALDAQRAARHSRGADDLLIFGSDISGDMLVKARANLERAGLPSLSLKQLDARAMTAPSTLPGVLVANPPYGERIDVRGGARGERLSGPREDSRRHGESDERGRRAQHDEATHFTRAGPDADELDADFFRAFGDALKQQFTGWHAFVLTSDRKLPGLVRLREARKTPLFNGAIECRLFRFDLVSGPLERG